MNTTELFSTFNDAGIEYATRSNPRGQQYLSFNWGSDVDQTALPLTFLLDNQVLRITLHDLPCSLNSQLQRRASLLPIGALFQVADTERPAISFGLFLGENSLSKNDLFSLLAYIQQCQRYLITPSNAIPQKPDFEMAIQLDTESLQAMFDELGHKTRKTTEGIEVDIVTLVGINYQLNLSIDAGWVVAYGHRFGPSAINIKKHQLDTFQRLQQWATSGCFLIDQEMNLNSKVAIPILKINPKRSAIWSASQLVAMLQTAAQHLHK